jgi:hypothetical protein
MSESRVEQDVEPRRASRIRCKESKKGRRWEKLKNNEEKRP